MKKIIPFIFAFFIIGTIHCQPTDWQNFSATGCNGKTQSIRNVIEDSLKPLILIWEGYDCPFCREDGPAWATSAKTYGHEIVYWSAFGRINGNATCEEAASWHTEYDVPSRNFVFLDKLAENNWSQPAPGQGRWYWVISRDKVTKNMKIAYSGNIVKDAELIARRAKSDFLVVSSTKTSENLSGFNLYPNPSTESITVDIDLYSSAKVSLDIADLMGKSYKTIEGVYQNLSEKIDVSTLPSGVYVLNCKIDGLSSSKLFVVQ